MTEQHVPRRENLGQDPHFDSARGILDVLMHDTREAVPFEELLPQVVPFGGLSETAIADSACSFLETVGLVGYDQESGLVTLQREALALDGRAD